jgi:hypothetical protein
MSADDAITAARVIDDNATGFPAAALQAELTLRGSIPSSPNDAGSHSPIDRVPVWLVTFTSPKPVDVSAGLAPVYVTHDSVAIDPASGEFVLGFYTP